MEKQCGIYCIRNLVNNKCYIGQSRNIHKRWIAHLSASRNPRNKSYDYPLQRAIRKYGMNNFVLSIIELCEPDHLNGQEIRYISEYRSNDNAYGYNVDKGGDTNPHFYKLSEEKILDIIGLLKTTNQTSDEIGSMYGVTGRTIRGINTGEYSKMNGIQYPVRAYSYSNRMNTYVRIHSAEKPKCFCTICGKEISGISDYCRPCSQRKVQNRPSPIKIARLVKENGFAKTGKMFGVDGNVIKKWCVYYGIPYLKKDLIAWYEENSKDVKE